MSPAATETAVRPRAAVDSSVVVGWLLQEPGWQGVDRVVRAGAAHGGPELVLPGPALTESVSVTRRAGNTSPVSDLALVLRSFFAVEPLTADDHVRAAEVHELSRRRPVGGATLSLADAMILAVVERLGVVVFTRDRLWSDLVEEGVLPRLRVQRI